jgi:2',3'-cyclic-nucleotide 2'-phosphodiesterase (5'-nucleotidase family)
MERFLSAISLDSLRLCGKRYHWIVASAVLVLAFSASLAVGEVVGKTTGPLDASKARQAESSLGNLVADAARGALKAEIALVPASQFREVTLPAGDLTREALTNALLYPDEKIVLVEITGAQVRAALERGLSMLPRPNVAFLQLSGLAVTFRSDAPEGERVLGVQVGGSALVAERTYQAAMPSSLAKGSLGYFRVFNGLKPTKTGPALADVLVDHVRGKTVSPQTGRLRDLAPAAEGQGPRG